VLKKTVEYEDYNGEQVKEDLFFNLTKAELVELELSEEGGLANALQKIIDSEDGRGIVAQFKKILLMAYGIRSSDGKRFIKTQQLREEFESSEAYSTLFMELVTDAEYAAEFVNAIIPSGLAEEVAEISTASQRESKPEEYEFEQLTGTSEVKKLTKDDIQTMSEEELKALPEKLALGQIEFA
jgi:hypothetical protein